MTFAADTQATEAFASVTESTPYVTLPRDVTMVNIDTKQTSSIDNIFLSPTFTLTKPPTSTPKPDVTMIVVANGVACACIRIYSPVCGTDNKSYFNPCLLACEHGNKDPKVTVQYDGNCIPF